MATKIANYKVLHQYLGQGQRTYAQATQDAPDTVWLNTTSMIHNDGPDVRAEFMINKAGKRILVDMPLEVFNRLPTTEDLYKAVDEIAAKTITKAERTALLEQAARDAIANDPNIDRFQLAQLIIAAADRFLPVDESEASS